jgi:hypothetical protein
MLLTTTTTVPASGRTKNGDDKIAETVSNCGHIINWNTLASTSVRLDALYHLVEISGVCIAARFGATLSFEPEAFLDERTLVLLRGVQSLFNICACLGVALALEAFVAYDSG